MSDAVNERSVVRNKNLWHSVEVVRDRPDLDAIGPAGARMKLDLLLLKPEGMSPEDHAGLREVDIEVLRSMAMAEDPAFGITHQAAAIGALAEQGDRESLLLLADRARDRSADDRVRIAAIHALGEIGGPGVDSVVRGLIRARQASIQLQAIRALAKVGGPADIGTLAQVASEGDDTIAGQAKWASDVLLARTGVD